MRISGRWGVAIAIGLFMLLPAAATAAPVDVRSDRAALRAYAAWVRDALAIVPAWRRTDDAYAASIKARCPNALASLKHARRGTVSQTAVIRFGFEAGGDLDAVGYHLLDAPLAKMASTLVRLRWSGRGTRATINRYLAAEHGLLQVGPSDLCADAKGLAAAHGRHATGATRRWVKRYTRRVITEATDEGTFLVALDRLATPREQGLVNEIKRLVRRYAKAIEARSNSVTTRVIQALGL